MEIVGFEHFHVHTTHGSILDGFARMDEISEHLVRNNQKFICITDHGMMSAVPEMIKESDKHNLNPIFGCELYVNPLQPNKKKKTDEYTDGMTQEEKNIFKKSYHLIAIAYNDQGYKNLVHLSSWAHIEGFYRYPRVNYDQLKQYRDGIIFSSACFNSVIGQKLNNEGEDAAMQMVETYRQMFGDKFYLEMMLLDFDKQRAYNQFLIKAHDKYHIPLTISNDVHYSEKEDAKFQMLMLMVRTQRTLADLERAKQENQDLFELQDTNLWLKSEEELNEKWEKDYQDIDYDIFKEAKLNSVRICEQAKGVKLDRSIKLPVIENANEKLLDYIKQGLIWRNYPKTKETLDRIKEEYEVVTQKEFSSYFLLQKMMTDEARRVCPKLLGWGDGSEACGPGRGSSAGSLILYLLGVTNVDPIKHELLFSRFLSPARGGKTMKLKFSGKPKENV